MTRSPDYDPLTSEMVPTGQVSASSVLQVVSEVGEDVPTQRQHQEQVFVKQLDGWQDLRTHRGTTSHMLLEVH